MRQRMTARARTVTVGVPKEDGRPGQGEVIAELDGARGGEPKVRPSAPRLPVP